MAARFGFDDVRERVSRWWNELDATCAGSLMMKAIQTHLTLLSKGNVEEIKSEYLTDFHGGSVGLCIGTGGVEAAG